MKFPKIGLRMIKTAIAVFFCLFIELLLRWLISDTFALSYYSPFFSGLAAVYSLNNRKDNSIALAKMRVFGSIVGGTFGALFLYGVYALLYQFGLIENTLTFDAIRYLLITLGVLILIYLLNSLKWQHMVFIATLTFLAVAVGNRTDLPYYIYAINRTGSTIIGVSLSIFINLFSVHLYRNRHLSVMTSVDGVLLRNTSSLSNYQKFNLSMLIDDQLDVYINTSRSPATLIPLFADLDIHHPMIVMDGSAVYQFNESKFTDVICMSKETTKEIHRVLDSFQLNYFSHVIIDHRLQIYYKSLKNLGDLTFYHTRKNEFFRHFAKGLVPVDELVCYEMIVVENETVDLLIQKLRAENLPVHLSHYAFREQNIEGFSLVRITADQADKQMLFERVKKNKSHELVVAFGHRSSDVAYFKNADFKVCYYDATMEIKNLADYIIPSDSADDIIPLIKKLYYQRHSIQKFKKNRPRQSV